MCMVDGADACDFYEETRPKARKLRRCYECGRDIPIGEIYLRAAYKQDGKFGSFALCAHCAGAASWLVKHCGGYLGGSILEDLEEHWGESYDEDRLFLGRAIVGMRKKWRRKDGSLMRPLRDLEREQRTAA